MPLEPDFKLKELTHIYIIESQSPQDIIDGISEGHPLSEKLKELNITHEYYNVKDEITFKEAIKNITTSLKTKTKALACVHLHLSMHGNSLGVGLTSGELITWHALADQLYSIAKEIGVLRTHGNMYFPFALSFSTCHGIEGVGINIALAVLFQPIFKIALGRELWNIADVIVGSSLLVSIFLNKD